MDAQTILELLENSDDNAVALSAPGRTDLTFGAISAQIFKSGKLLSSLNVGRNDRVAIVLPNGPEMASAFVSVGAWATTAPLNPNYKADEYEFYLSDLNAKLLIVREGVDSPSREVAAKLGLQVVELTVADGAAAGEFDLKGVEMASLPPTPATKDDIALVLHTSGTTSRPKIVPLTQTNVAASAKHIRETLSLSPTDKCMSMMPLFHIHGLIAAVLSSLGAGASIYCAPGFNALKVFEWLKDSEPTWYTAVPTMHQTLLARASRNKEVVESTKLRFIRSSSASLPPAVMEELEATFGCPVIESYGMTEAAHQMASNQLPPGLRKSGFVGAAAGPKVSIMDSDGNLVEQGGLGEVVISGPNVTLGYENNPKANEENFTNDWFRTGDQGFLDEDGFLKITGRLKEIINRGGEKISPLEVDDTLMDHPAVQQVVTFAKPHKMLGEDVAAVIVLKEGMEATDREIKDFASERLAGFKVPATILFMDEKPKGATGKLQRIGLAEKLGIA